MFIDLPLEILKWLVIFCVVWICISYAIRQYNDFGVITSRWYHPFIGEKFSTQEIYKAVTAAVRARNIPDVTITSTTHAQAGILAGRREYLRIVRGDVMFLVCAAPFGDDYFISYWLGKPIDFMQDLLTRIPYIGRVVARLMYAKTYYQIDTESMFLESVKHAVLEVVDSLTNAKGIRPLSDLERMPVSVPPQFK